MLSQKFDPANWQKLVDPERAEHLNPERVVVLTGILPGETVVDVGTGVGYFLQAILTAVGPEGTVYGVDISQEMLDKVAEEVGESAQVRLVHSQELAIPLEDNLADHVFVANVFHEIDPAERVAFLQELRRLLRPTGRLTLVEWKKEETPHGPPVEVRLGREEIVSYLYQAGFRFRRSEAAGPYHYLLQASLKEGIFGGDLRP